MRSRRRDVSAFASRGVVAAWLVLAASALAGAQSPAPAPAHAGEVLLERTVAIVAGNAVTQSEVDLAVELGLLTLGASGGDAATAVVDRSLMLHEVARFAPAEPDAAAVAARLTTVRARAGGDEALATVLTRSGFTSSRLAAWLRDDLRITAYLDQRFASAGVPAEADVTAYTETHRVDLERAGVPAADLTRVARERLVADRRRDLIGDWLSDLRRRTDVVEFRRGRG